MGKHKHINLEDRDEEAEEGLSKAEEGTEAGGSGEAEGKRKRKRKRKEKKDDAVEEGDDGEKAASGGELTAEDVPGSENFTNDRTVYIEGLPFEASEMDVQTFFQPAGGSITSCRLPTWHDSGRLRGYGHVEFDTAEACKKALELDGSYMKKRFIKIERPRVPRILQQAAMDKSKIVRPAGCKSVFVKNIPYDTTEEDMREAFKVCGVIDNVRLALWGHTNQLKGFGYVDFKREDSAEIAVKKTGSITMKGRALLIDFETGQAKMSFKKQKDRR